MLSRTATTRKITIDELLETAKTVDALLITLNEKCRKDVIDKMPENIKCISTFSIGFDHIDLEACKARGIKVGNAPHGVTVATAEIAMLLLLGSARRASRRRAHDPHAFVARLAAAAARRPASRRQEARHLRLRQDRAGVGAARPRLRDGNPLLRYLPAASGEGEGSRRDLSRHRSTACSRSRSSSRSTRR